MRRSRERLGLFAAAALGLFIAVSAAAQDVSPLTPMAGKDGPRAEPTADTPPNGQGVVIPLPQAANRVPQTADRRPQASQHRIIRYPHPAPGMLVNVRCAALV